MKPAIRSPFMFVIFILLAGTACGGMEPAATLEPVKADTSTPLPVHTATKRPTSTPRPTVTVLPTPTPAQVGVPVTTDLYEVTVVKVRKLESVYIDSLYRWEANPGYLFLELGIKVKNLQPGTPVASFWENVYVIDENGDRWFPGWAAYKPVASGVEINPFGIVFAELQTGHEPVNFEDTAFLRAIWTIEDNNPSKVLFGFEDSPQVEVTVD